MRRLETISERFPQPKHRRHVGMDIDQLALVENETAQIVDAMDMVGMRMRINGRVKALDRRQQHLLAEIRPGVDDDSRAAAVGRDPLDQCSGAHAPVLRIVRIAIAPVAGDARRARRRAAAENGEAQPVGHRSGALLDRPRHLAEQPKEIARR